MNSIQEKIYQLEKDPELSEEMRLKLRVVRDLFANLPTKKDEAVAEELVDSLPSFIKKPVSRMKPKARTFLEQAFYDYLLKKGRTEKCAYDYLMRLRRLCAKEGLSLEEASKNPELLEKLYNEYTNPKCEEKYNYNSSNHYGPSSALNKFREFLEDDLSVARKELSREHLYLEWSDEYQSFCPVDKHIVGYRLDDRDLTIRYKEGHFKELPSETRKVSEEDYCDLINVFLHYKDLLSQSNVMPYEVRPYGGGGGTYKYKFQNKKNFDGNICLFEDQNETIVARAFKDFNQVMSKILK